MYGNKYYNDMHAHNPRKKFVQKLVDDFNVSDGGTCLIKFGQRPTIYPDYRRSSSYSVSRNKIGSDDSSLISGKKLGLENSATSRRREEISSGSSNSRVINMDSATSSYSRNVDVVSSLKTRARSESPISRFARNVIRLGDEVNARKIPNKFNTIKPQACTKTFNDQQTTTVGRLYSRPSKTDSFHTDLKENKGSGAVITNDRMTRMPGGIPDAVIDAKESAASGMDWNDYHRLGVIHQFMDDLEVRHPAICTINNIGQSVQGRDIKLIHLSNSNASNRAVWLDAGIHAREWIAPAVATYVINHVANNFDKLQPSMKNKDWYILPVMNPDGYEHSHTRHRMWRKNRATDIYGNVVGVDLNRNFSYGWGALRGCSKNPSNELYCGPSAFSEPESCAVRDFILSAGSKITVYITLHCYGQNIMFPFSCKDELCPDYVRLLEGATEMTKAIYRASGCTYKVGISRDLMYGAAGTSCDWSYGIGKIPFCYLIELRSKEHKFLVPKEEIEQTGEEILSSLRALMHYVDTSTW